VLPVAGASPREPDLADEIFTVLAALQQLWLVVDEHAFEREHALLRLCPPRRRKAAELAAAASTRWHGMISGTGLRAIAMPTSCAAPGAPARLASSP
jgi:hypothetical protein